MPRFGVEQEQTASGNDAIGIQSGRDTTIVIEGISPTEALKLIDHVVEHKLQHFQQTGLVEAVRRVKEIQEETVQRLVQINARLLEAFGDPDVQAALLQAQLGYARSGRDDVRKTLVDLIALRCNAENGSLVANATNQAIEVAHKLTRTGIKAMTLSFLVANSKLLGIKDIDQISRWAEANILPFANQPYATQREIDHLVAVGCARIETGTIEISTAMHQTYPGLFQSGVMPNSINEGVLNHAKADEILRDCPRNPGHLEANVVYRDELDEKADLLADARLKEMYRPILNTRMGDKQIEELLLSKGEFWAELYRAWRATAMLNRLRLTSVGIAVAHCHWSSTTNADIPLSSWLGEA